MLRNNKSKEIESLFANSGKISDKVFTYDQIKSLPDPVQRYFKYALKEGQEYISYVRLKQDGLFRMNENSKWIPIIAEQYFTTQNPAFLWYCKIKPLPFFWITGKDSYFQNEGNLIIKLLSIITVVNLKGEECDQSEFIRYIAESVWFPTALLPNEFLNWEPIDSETARVIINYRGYNLSFIFYFNAKGQIIKLTTEDRFMEEKGEFKKEKWSCYCRKYKKINNVRIPTEGEVEWNLPDKNISYAKLRIIDIEFNKTSKY